MDGGGGGDALPAHQVLHQEQRDAQGDRWLFGTARRSRAVRSCGGARRCGDGPGGAHLDHQRHLAAVEGVQPAGQLVDEQHPGAGDEGDADVAPLGLAARDAPAAGAGGGVGESVPPLTPWPGLPAASSMPSGLNGPAPCKPGPSHHRRHPKPLIKISPPVEDAANGGVGTPPQAQLLDELRHAAPLLGRGQGPRVLQLRRV